MSGLGTALSILMVGHSLFSFDGPSMLQSALRAGTGEGAVQAQIINGAPLKYNWENSARAQGVDARALLPEGDITHLILTEAVPLENHLKWSETGIYAEAFASLALTANPETRVYVQETWHSLKSGTGERVEYDDKADVPWRTRLEEDLPRWEGIVAEMAAQHPEARDQFALIPAGQALGHLHDEIAAGRVAGLSDIAALFGDDIHLNHRGHYFVAMVQYATITGQSPLGLPTNFSNQWGQPYQTPDPDLARELQLVAWDAVPTYRQAAPEHNAPLTPVQRAEVAPAAPRAPPDTPLAPLIPENNQLTPGSGELGIGLASLKDWGTQQPFLDLMKTARPWIGHEPGRWGGMDHDALRAGGYLDEDGWPRKMPRNLSSIGTLILTDMPEEALSLAGRYRLRFTGQGVIEVRGRATNVRYGPGEVRFDYEPGPGPVDIRIQRINRADPPRITSIVKLDHAGAFDAGAVFNPDWLSRMQGFDALRFMDWAETSNSTLSNWDDRPEPDDATWWGAVPLETMIALANEMGVDPWFNVPHLADDSYVRNFAHLLRDRLDPNLRAYVEFSNEVWNWQFDQARWADESGRARWGKDDTWMQFYGLRAAEVARIMTEVFGPEAEKRLVNVISTQTGWLGLETEALDAPLAQAEGLPAPASAFDAYAVTGYFGGQLGYAESTPMVDSWLQDSLAQAQAEAEAQSLNDQSAEDFVARHRYDLASQLAARELKDGALSGDETSTLKELLGRFWPHHAAVAQKYGLDLVAYEGGTHVVGVGAEVDNAEVTAFMHHFNYSPEVAELYDILLKGWKASEGQLFLHYADVQWPTKWGSWGVLRHLDDSNPRWDALVAAQ
ncbi:MAG: hypothetical protein HKN30_11210 [Sulfitobacter sp.]|nr:hypothetical protein [Sulfitobacter sp.]